ncbi:MAG: hypothetical protein KF878_06520 [Planctomycetes bacterium]|nr:hypothetical protein [Planctomycetota bacterium]
MLDVQGWLACPGCGAWAGGEALCPGCGAARGARVPLDQSPGDGSWVVSARGEPEAVLQALEVRGDVDRDVLERVGVARRVVEGAGQPVSLWLDLRPAEAGHVARRTRNPGAQDTVFVLPWLLLRRGDAEARLVRTVHQRMRRAFVRGGAETTTSARLDELVVLGPTGARRRPVARLDRLGALDWSAADDDAPEPAPLPPTAPGQPGAGGRAPLALGLAAAGFRCWASCRWASAWSSGEAAAPRRDPRARRAARTPGPSPERVDEVVAFGAGARDAVRVAARSGGPWAQIARARRRRGRPRAARAGAPPGRQRRPPGRQPGLRATAIDLLATEAFPQRHAHRTSFAARARGPRARRATAPTLRALLRHDPRAGRSPSTCSPASAPTPLRRACLRALGATGAVRGARRRSHPRPPRPRRRRRPGPRLPRPRGWALAGLVPGDARAGAAPGRARRHAGALAAGRARSVSGRRCSAGRSSAPGCRRPLDGLRAHPGLAAPAARALRADR